METTPGFEQRFWEKVDRAAPGDCWTWTASKVTGYGKIGLRGKFLLAHRVSYELLIGPIPVDLTLDHLCRNRACVNPAHLEPVTNKVNIMRGIGVGVKNAAKTRCARGHAFTPENTYVTPRGRRRCKTCQREAVRRCKQKTSTCQGAT